MNDNNINYSLGTLIILLLMFWFTCKCIGQNNDHYYTREKFIDDTKLMYGNSPITLSSSTIPYIRMDAKNLIEVPNSKSAMRHLFDEDMVPCKLDTSIDDDGSIMHMRKKEIESYKELPRGLTDQRKYQNIDRRDRIPMPSY
jgi:hypothetical protein